MKVELIRDPDLKKTYLGAYQQRDEHHPVKVTFYNYIEKYNGVTVYRPCTEWFFLVFYILFTIATITLSILCIFPFPNASHLLPIFQVKRWLKVRYKETGVRDGLPH